MYMHIKCTKHLTYDPYPRNIEKHLLILEKLETPLITRYLE